MDTKSSGRALLMLSIAYGLVVGLLGAIGFDRVDLVAVVGAVVLGWHGGFVALAAVTAVAIVWTPASPARSGPRHSRSSVRSPRGTG